MGDIQEHQALEDALQAEGTVWSGAPALAASTVAMVNTSGRKVGVRIDGGAWTVVKVNDVTITGLTSTNVPHAAYVPLRDKDSLAITYSSAPTLQWFLED